jgi:hypothetical protein
VSAHTRQALEHMDGLINAGDRAAAYASYMALFHPEVRAWGLYLDGAADLARIRQHYHPVFFELGGGVLVSDQVITAGSMAAQRYHSLMRLNGVFDGVEAKDKPVVIRGQTIFRLDGQGRILERWSNHDHAYRMGQLLGSEGRAAGARLARSLNGPGLSEAATREALERLVAAFNQPEAPKRRYAEIRQLLSPDLVLHGLHPQAQDADFAAALLDELWRAFPDLVVDTGTPITAWSFVAAEWRATGSRRAPFRGSDGSAVPVCLSGETVLRLDDSGRVAEAWIDAGPVHVGSCPAPP